MHNPLRLARWAATLAPALLLASCGSPGDSTANIIVIGTPESPFESGVRLAPAAQLVRAATAEGLLGLDEQGRIVPALADRWIVTDGGASYIFRLRDGTWRDGEPITAENARDALRRALASLRGAPMATDLSAIDEIRVMAGRVIEVRLSRPVPDLLQLLAQPELGLVHKGRGAGPMQLGRDMNGAVLTPIAPKDRGLPDIADWTSRTRALHLSAMPATAAVERFGKGDANLVLGGTFADFPVAVGAGLSRGAIQFDPVQGLFGLIATGETGLLASAATREAVAMAIDREALIAAVGLSGWKPSTRIVAAELPGDLGSIGERWTELSLAERQDEAARRIAGWRRNSGEPALLRVALPSGTGADRLFEALSADLKTVGVEARRVGPAAPADLRLLDIVARYARAEWFLNQLDCSARRGLCSVVADRRAEEARSARDASARAALLAEAEAELTQANVFIPFGPPIRWSLVRDKVGLSFFPNRWGMHPLMPMAMRPK